jgi:hypothetical protein
MKIEIKKIINFGEVTEELIWEGTEDEIFNKFYKENNRLRYCNGTHYKFKWKIYEKRYDLWFDSLTKQKRFDMYYGNGTVD